MEFGTALQLQFARSAKRARPFRIAARLAAGTVGIGDISQVSTGEKRIPALTPPPFRRAEATITPEKAAAVLLVVARLGAPGAASRYTSGPSVSLRSRCARARSRAI